jgi:YggT family protein
MVIQLLLLVLQTLVGFFTSILLFRFYCSFININLKWFGGNLGLFVFRVTDWLVLPVRKLIPSFKSIDFASIVLAYSVQFIYLALNLRLTSSNFDLQNVLISALFDLLSACISGFTTLIFISSILSWFSIDNQIKNLFQVLVNPLLNPLRNHISLIAGVDISPLIALLFLQVLNVLIQGLRLQLIH